MYPYFYEDSSGEFNLLEYDRTILLRICLLIIPLISIPSLVRAENLTEILERVAKLVILSHQLVEYLVWLLGLVYCKLKYYIVKEICWLMLHVCVAALFYFAVRELLNIKNSLYTV